MMHNGIAFDRRRIINAGRRDAHGRYGRLQLLNVESEFEHDRSHADDPFADKSTDFDGTFEQISS